MVDLDSVARDNFTVAELMFVNTADASSKEHAFYTCWTRKEAYIKAVGKGLSIPLNSFDTFIPPGLHGRQVSGTEDLPSVASWWLSDLSLPVGYVGALVSESKMPVISYLKSDFGR